MKTTACIGMSLALLFAGTAHAGHDATPASSAASQPAPAPGSKFSKIRVGMDAKEVLDLIGPPNDQKTYMTGKAFIPFHFGGADETRTEVHYKGEGTLTYSSGGVSDMSERVMRITVNPAESGYVH